MDHADRAPADLPVLWLCGAPGTGKSVTAWELFQRHRDAQVAYVDIDQLKMLSPRPGDVGQLAAENLAALARVHHANGTAALIVSGVIGPDQGAHVAAALADFCELTWCLLEADDDTLRRRITARGWPDELADLAVRDAHELHTAPFIDHRWDTTHTPVAAVADAVGQLLRPRAAGPGRPSSSPEPRPDPGSVVALFGPRAVGKSTVAWSWFMQESNAGTPTAFLDADQLGFVHAEPARRDRIASEAVRALSANFARRGALRTIVNGNLTPDQVAGLTAQGATTIYLDAADQALHHRIRARRDGNVARLAGDDLADADAGTQSAVLAEAARQRAGYDAAHLSALRLDTTDVAPDELVATIAGHVQMPRPAARNAPPDLSRPPVGGIDNGACCVIVTGPPAAGKSTLSKRLARHLRRSAFLNGDAIHWLVVGGRVWALGEPRDEARRQVQLGNANLISLARNCADARFTPVIDWIIPDQEQLQQFLDGLHPLPVWLIVLDPGADEARRRNGLRQDAFAFDGYDALIDGMRAAFGDRAWWIDSSDQAEEETLALIVDRAEARPS